MKTSRIITFFPLFILGSLLQAQNYIEYREMFTKDTIRIEKLAVDMQDEDYSTIGIVKALNKLEDNYDGLLNKYYKELLNSISKEKDKEVLKVSQRNWIKFRDNEKELVRTLVSQEYEKAGGGTIWSIVAVNRIVEITKQRVIEIYNFLLLGWLGAG